MAKAKDRVSDMKPYVTRALQDEEVRENVKHAIATARDIYDELLGGRSTTAVATRVATDSEIQEQLRTAIEDLRKAANRVQGKKEHSSRNATLYRSWSRMPMANSPPKALPSCEPENRIAVLRAYCRRL